MNVCMSVSRVAGFASPLTRRTVGRSTSRSWDRSEVSKCSLVDVTGKERRCTHEADRDVLHPLGRLVIESIEIAGDPLPEHGVPADVAA